MTLNSSIATLFNEHIAIKNNRMQEMMHSLKLNNVIIYSGNTKIQFADDARYPFVANPFFREWLPLDKRAGCFLHFNDLNKLTLYLLDREDIWHSEPQQLPDNWDQHFEIKYYQDANQLFSHELLSNISTAFISEDNIFELGQNQFNTTAVLNNIDFHRQFKTPYEQHCLREANRLAIPCHLAAKNMFLAGGSELDIQRAYLTKANCSENDMPYSIISGVNEHAAILHHTNLSNIIPKQPKSLLIDAGLVFNCYASDITRTYAFDQHCEFAELINDVNTLQLAVVDAVKVGVTYAQLNQVTHEKLAQVLIDYKIINLDIEEALETKITSTFMPHGVGHGLGVNVHERGRDLCSADGQQVEKSRYGLEKKIVANEVLTIETGIYFIPALLNQLKKEQAHVINWNRIDQLIPFGGIRIEDNILVNANGEIENLTRQVY